MDKLWIGNVPPDTSDEELLELVKKYSGLDGQLSERIPGDGSRPAVIIVFAGAPFGAVTELALRLQGLRWKECTIHASTLQH